jgi:hypothetical protein
MQSERKSHDTTTRTPTPPATAASNPRRTDGWASHNAMTSSTYLPNNALLAVTTCLSLPTPHGHSNRYMHTANRNQFTYFEIAPKTTSFASVRPPMTSTTMSTRASFRIAAKPQGKLMRGAKHHDTHCVTGFIRGDDCRRIEVEIPANSNIITRQPLRAFLRKLLPCSACISTAHLKDNLLSRGQFSRQNHTVTHTVRTSN